MPSGGRRKKALWKDVDEFKLTKEDLALLEGEGAERVDQKETIVKETIVSLEGKIDGLKVSFSLEREPR